MNQELPTISLVKSESFNFYYSDIPKHLKMSLWKFSLFTDPFENTTWILLSTCFTIIAAILIMCNCKSERADLILLLLFSATLQLGTNALPKKSGLFLMWLGTSMLFVFIYSGEVTSTLIRPPQDAIMTEITEVFERKYKLYVTRPAALQVWKVTSEFMKPNSKIRNMMDYFVQNAIVDGSDASVHSGSNDFLKKLVFSDEKVFTMRSWIYSLQLMQQGNQIIQTEAKTNREKARICYLGQELINFDETFFVTFPPSNKKLGKGYQLLFQTGMVNRLMDEVHGGLASTRVQNRTQILSRTKLAMDQVTYVSLKMEGKIITVFLLWVFCVIICMLVVGGERVHFRFVGSGTVMVHIIQVETIQDQNDIKMMMNLKLSIKLSTFLEKILQMRNMILLLLVRVKTN